MDFTVVALRFLGKLPGLKELKDLLVENYEMRLLREIKEEGNLPCHVGIILNVDHREGGRGRSKGVEIGRKLGEVLGWCLELGIENVTVFARSKEPPRAPESIGALASLFEWVFKEMIGIGGVVRDKIRVRAIGDLGFLPEYVSSMITEIERATKSNDHCSLNIIAGHDGRKELSEAIRKISELIKKEELRPADVNEGLVNDYLYTKGLPDPDLIIRTSGEERLSGFLLWQSAYSELYFCEANWPTFDRKDFLSAISTYQKRQRRFGR